MSKVAIQLKKVEEKIKSLNKFSDKNYITKGFLTDLGNIKMMNIDELLRSVASILVRKDYFIKANEIMGTNKEFILDDFTVEEWIQDIKLAKNILETSETLNKLKKLEKKYKELLENEDKLAILNEELDSI